MSGLPYSPPLYYFNGIDYNEAFFVNQNGSTLSKAYLDSTYLLRVGVANSTATITNFSGLVSISQLLTASGGLQVTNGLTCDTGTATTSLSAPIINATSTSLYSNFFNLSVTNLSVTTLTLSSLTLSSTCTAQNFIATGSGSQSSFYNTYINGITFCNYLSNTSATLPYTLSCGSVSIPSGTNSNSGLQIGWNANTGNGESDFTNLSQGGVGGFQFGTISNTSAYRALCSINPYANQGFWLFSNCGRLRIDDRNGGAFWWGQSQEGSQMIMGVNGISTSIALGCGNSSGVGSTCLSINTGGVSPNVNFNPLSTSTFNVSHPTTSLGNNISTNTTQYATVGFVNANSAGALLTSNNTWSGTNSFTQNTISIGSGLLSFGRATGNAQSIVIGDNSSLATVSASAVYNISIGVQSMYLTTAQQCCSFGNFNLSALTTGSTNHVYGSGCGQSITTGINNIICGLGSWNTGNFSNCAVFGVNAPSPTANNSVILGSSADTVLISGSTIFGSNIQVNGNIIQPIQTFVAGVLTTFTTLPPFVFFTPIAGMSFVWPAPSAGNSGQTFTIRRIATGGGQTISNTITGGISAWWLTSGTAPIANIAISTVWSFTFISNGSGYYQIA